MPSVLVTCPPMLGMIDAFVPAARARGFEVEAPTVVQALSEEVLCTLVPRHDGWIIGDDPATRRVFQAGRAGRLRAAVKWGIGVDNVDFEAARELGIPITNTPNMFGREVADVALAYVTGLARELFPVDREVRAGRWPKPRGISLKDRMAGLVGFGDIGQNTARRLLAAEMRVIAYDPAFSALPGWQGVELATWPRRVEECDFLVFTCSLTQANRHMLNAEVLAACRPGLRVVNVARGPLIDEPALCAALASGRVHSAALDVLESEPLPASSPLRGFPRCVFGSHNASNTEEAVRATSERAMRELFGFLGA
jgi:D-3-phosphoglycerate dehydrogenase